MIGATLDIESLWRELERLDWAAWQAGRRQRSLGTAPGGDDIGPEQRTRSVRAGLRLAAGRAASLLPPHLAGVDSAAIGGLLLPACSDLALLHGTSILHRATVISGVHGRGAGVTPVPGAAAPVDLEAQVDAWWHVTLGVASLRDGLQPVRVQALRHYARGIGTAWGLGLLEHRPDALGAGIEIAAGHVALVAAWIEALAACLARERAAPAARGGVRDELNRSRGPGPELADWAAANEEELVRHAPAVPVQRRIVMGSSASGFAATPAQLRRALQPDEASDPPAAAPPAATHWLEIVLLGDDDRPVPGERFSVRLPEGRTVEGRLDGQGSARLEGLAQAGTCEVCFPDLDASAWQPLTGE